MQNRFYELTNKVLRTDGGQQIEIYKDLIRSFLNFESAIKNNDDKSIQMQFNQGIELAIELVNASGPKISHEEWDQLTNNIQLLIESNNLTANKLTGKRLDTKKYSTCVAKLNKTIKDLDEISKNNLGNNANNSVAINATRSTKAFEKNYIKIINEELNTLDRLTSTHADNTPLIKALVASFKQLQFVVGQQDQATKNKYAKRLEDGIKLANELTDANTDSPVGTVSKELKKDITLLIQSNMYACYLLKPTSVTNENIENLEIITKAVKLIDFTKKEKLDELAKNLDDKILEYRKFYDIKTSAMNNTKYGAVALALITACATVLALAIITAPLAAIMCATGVFLAIGFSIMLAAEMTNDRSANYRFFLDKAHNKKTVDAHHKTQDFITEHVIPKQSMKK